MSIKPSLPSETEYTGSSFRQPPAWRILRRSLRSAPASAGLLVILLFLAAAVFTEQLAPYDPTAYHFGQDRLPPAWVNTASRQGSPAFLLGTDSAGRDLLSRALYGARTAALVAFLGVPLAILIGLPVGMIAGYLGGGIDLLIMRLVETVQSFPAIMFYILMSLVLRATPLNDWANGLGVLSLSYGLVAWTGLARLVRAQSMSIRSEAFIEAAWSIGASTARILRRHLLPNLLGGIAVWITFAIPQSILVEALLGYLGIRIGPTAEGRELPVYSWGGLFFDGRSALSSRPEALLIPLVCIVLVCVAFTYFGDALRDALDPRYQDGA